MRKQKVVIRFNAMPQPGHIVALYAYPRDTHIAEAGEWNYYVEKAKQGDWDSVEGCDLLLCSTLFEGDTTELLIDRVCPYIRGFRFRDVMAPRYIKGHPDTGTSIGFSRFWAKELDVYFYFNEKREVVFRYIGGTQSVGNTGNTPSQRKPLDWVGAGMEFDYYSTGEPIDSNSKPALKNSFRTINWPMNVENGNLTEVPVSEMTLVGRGIVNLEARLYETRLTEYMEIKEKKIVIDKERKETDIVEIPDVYNYTNQSLSVRREAVWMYEAAGGYSAGEYIDPLGPIIYPSRPGILLTSYLTYFNTIYLFWWDGGFYSDTEILDLYDNPIIFPSMGYQAVGRMIDKESEKVYYGTGTDYMKISSKVNGYAYPLSLGDEILDPEPSLGFIKQNIYFNEVELSSNSAFTNNSIFKANDHDAYIIDLYDHSLLWKDNKEYTLPLEKTYNINGVDFPVGVLKDRIFPPGIKAFFAIHFSCPGMGLHVAVRHPDDMSVLYPDFWGEEILNSHMTASWWGNYIYKIRVDELKDGTFIYDRFLKAGVTTDFIQVLTDEGLYDNLKNNLKIYQPETKYLWVEKYHVVYDEENQTADINYLFSFRNPFKHPMKKTLNERDGGTKWTLATSETQLCQIAFIPNKV